MRRKPPSCWPMERNDVRSVASACAASELSHVGVPKVMFCRSQAVSISSSVHGAPTSPFATHDTNPHTQTTTPARMPSARVMPPRSSEN